MNATEILAERRHKAAETEHLRVFFVRWCEMHRLINDKDAPAQDKQRAAQDLIDQANKVREFYA